MMISYHDPALPKHVKKIDFDSVVAVMGLSISTQYYYCFLLLVILLLLMMLHQVDPDPQHLLLSMILSLLVLLSS
jgi:NADH:ubiquinone oxidoreductase subunit 6 (subunit J)